MSPTINQVSLAMGDSELIRRIKLAASLLKDRTAGDGEAQLSKILAAPITNGSETSSLAVAYEYHWFSMQQMAPLALRSDLMHRINRVGADPSYVTDAQIREAVEFVLNPPAP